MATINNDLNFRAKLDTSEVEQKLDGLNKQTNNST